MATKSVSQEADDILLASSMITLGARLQVLEAETSLSHDRLARLYREIRGCSPPKGMLPFSVDWFMTWLPNIHSSLFYNVYSFLNTRTSSKGIRAIIDAYRLYLENAGVDKRAKLGATSPSTKRASGRLLPVVVINSAINAPDRTIAASP